MCITAASINIILSDLLNINYINQYKIIVEIIDETSLSYPIQKMPYLHKYCLLILSET